LLERTNKSILTVLNYNNIHSWKYYQFLLHQSHNGKHIWNKFVFSKAQMKLWTLESGALALILFVVICIRLKLDLIIHIIFYLFWYFFFYFLVFKYSIFLKKFCDLKTFRSFYLLKISYRIRSFYWLKISHDNNR